jgi:thiosulfate/3-mercaptopyruvate sulfurtransferase
MNKTPSLIKPTELLELIKNCTPGLKIIDCTYPFSVGARNFKKFRIENSIFLDLDLLRDTESELTLAFPNSSQFKDQIKRLNINKDSVIICYDQYGMYSSPRAWFIFKAYNFPNVCVLDGGLPNWMRSGIEIDRNTIPEDDFYEDSYFEPMDFKNEQRIENEDFKCDETMLAKFEEVIEISSLESENSKEALIIDTRPKMNFEMYPLPYSLNIPTDSFLNKDFTLKSKQEIQNMLSDRLKPETKIISSCGIGLSACLGVFAVKEVLGHQGEVKLYNGSFEEYSMKI